MGTATGVVLLSISLFVFSAVVSLQERNVTKTRLIKAIFFIVIGFIKKRDHSYAGVKLFVLLT
ncbi:hypothetical protein M667_18900 [Cellulophaga baltica NN016038]|nr:hypothetical protein M667_18900 [Cellulophaga baltica NN016038]